MTQTYNKEVKREIVFDSQGISEDKPILEFFVLMFMFSGAFIIVFGGIAIALRLFVFILLK